MPPPNLQVTIIPTDTQLFIIDLIWEEPASLINNSITNYTVRVNVSLALETSEQLLLDYENTTTETSLLYNISQDGIHLCSISVVTVDVSAHNKVGTGEAARETVLSNIDSELCTSSSVIAASVLLTSTATMTVMPALQPQLNEESPIANKNRMLIYGTLLFFYLSGLTIGSCSGR